MSFSMWMVFWVAQVIASCQCTARTLLIALQKGTAYLWKEQVKRQWFDDDTKLWASTFLYKLCNAINTPQQNVNDGCVLWCSRLGSCISFQGYHSNKKNMLGNAIREEWMMIAFGDQKAFWQQSKEMSLSPSPSHYSQIPGRQNALSPQGSMLVQMMRAREEANSTTSISC